MEEVLTAALFGLTSTVHCMGMCGGVVASQCADKEKSGNAILYYGIGRLISYTTVGAIVGLIGKFIGFNEYLRALVPCLCGVITILMGLQAAGLFRWLVPGRHCGQGCIMTKVRSVSPLVVGLLTGIMPCGTLQTVQYSALSSGSAGLGAMIMLAFAVTSTPGLVLTGITSHLLTTKGKKMMTIIAACIIIYMGLKMLLKGIKLMGAI